MSTAGERMLYGSSIDWRMLSSYVGGGCRTCGNNKSGVSYQITRGQL